MSDPEHRDNIPNLNSEQLKQKAEEILNDAPPEVKQAVKQSKSFYEENKKAIHTVIVGVVVLRVYKKKVAKQTAKAVVKALAAKGDGPIVPYANKAVPTMYDIWTDLKNTPNLAYIPHGGGMVHLLAGRDAVITAFGNFENMTTDEIWDSVRFSLGMRR